MVNSSSSTCPATEEEGVIHTGMFLRPRIATALQGIILNKSLETRNQFSIAKSQVYPNGLCEVIVKKVNPSISASTIMNQIKSCHDLMQGHLPNIMDTPNDLNSTIDISDSDDSVCILSPLRRPSRRVSWKGNAFSPLATKSAPLVVTFPNVQPSSSTPSYIRKESVGQPNSLHVSLNCLKNTQDSTQGPSVFKPQSDSKSVFNQTPKVSQQEDLNSSVVILDVSEDVNPAAPTWVSSGRIKYSLPCFKNGQDLPQGQSALNPQSQINHPVVSKSIVNKTSEVSQEEDLNSSVVALDVSEDVNPAAPTWVSSGRLKYQLPCFNALSQEKEKACDGDSEHDSCGLKDEANSTTPQCETSKANVAESKSKIPHTNRNNLATKRSTKGTVIYDSLRDSGRESITSKGTVIYDSLKDSGREPTASKGTVIHDSLKDAACEPTCTSSTAPDSSLVRGFGIVSLSNLNGKMCRVLDTQINNPESEIKRRKTENPNQQDTDSFTDMLQVRTSEQSCNSSEVGTKISPEKNQEKICDDTQSSSLTDKLRLLQKEKSDHINEDKSNQDVCLVKDDPVGGNCSFDDDDDDIIVEKEIKSGEGTTALTLIIDDSDDDLEICKVVEASKTLKAAPSTPNKSNKKMKKGSKKDGGKKVSPTSPGVEASATPRRKQGQEPPPDFIPLNSSPSKGPKKKKSLKKTRWDKVPAGSVFVSSTSDGPAPDFIPLRPMHRRIDPKNSNCNQRFQQKQSRVDMIQAKKYKKTLALHNQAARRGEEGSTQKESFPKVKNQEKYEFSNNIMNPNSGGTVNTGLRPVVIDASNVAIGHGRGKFSVKGLQICIKYFTDRGHKVYACVPKFRRSHVPPEDQKALDELENQGILCFTPSRTMPDGRKVVSYDDRFIVQSAAELGGIIVSTDNYRDLLQENESWRETIEQRLLMFTWIGDMLLFPNDPLGRNGPHLQDFLRFPDPQPTVEPSE